MKPITLEFSGFNSFKEKVRIDFEGLLSGGLFGIFGKTGSGKSTIIECMMYALFGKTAKKQNKAEFINNKSEEAVIDFTFEILENGERKRYNIRRIIKQKKENEVRLSVFDGKNFIPIEEKEREATARIEQIIGVGYEEFSKCIVLPQNEFAEFVKSTRTGRLVLMSKLFSLEKYDERLLASLKARRSALEIQLASANGGLQPYLEVSEEGLEERKVAEIAQKRHIDELESEFAALDAAVKNDADRYALAKRFAENDRKYGALMAAESWVNELKEKIAKADGASKIKEISDKIQALSEKRLQTLDAAAAAEREKTAKEEAHAQVAEGLSSGKDGDIARHTAVKSRIEENAYKVDEIEKLRREYSEKTKLLAEAKDKKEAIMCEKGHICQSMASLGDPNKKMEALFEQAGLGSLAAELNDEYAYFLSARSRVEPYAGGALYAEAVREIESKIKEIGERINALPQAADAEELPRRLEKIRSDAEKLASLREESAKKDSALASLDANIEHLTAECARLRADGESRKKELVKVSEEIGFDITTGEKLRAALAYVARTIDRMVAQQKKAAEAEKKLAEEIYSLREKIAVLKTNARAVQEEMNKCFSDRGVALLDYGFADEKSAFSHIIEPNLLKDFHAKVDAHDKELADCLAVRNALGNRDEALSFDSAKYEEMSTRSEELRRQKETLAADHRVFTVGTKEYENKLAAKKEYEKKVGEISKKLALCDKLGEVLSQHNLLNFIAEEYLEEICEGAARTLLVLSGGQYDIVYDKEFYVLDNLDCGSRRSVSTLSGGETFLVSLSLALSLSSAICEKTMRPVEFFFLDEGFGTLDSDLTDVVINSLDKLRSEHFAIGLISHVPELKQRISARINVIPATATEGSRLEITY